ncbi:biotin-dependent carboxyltransferase family protein [Pseudomonas taiwanensis]|uniref:5-oxoprolinase subunit C family protein n=1 Tax=Pseudomonas taiwanensis TaxID=470150 RepID=UPI000675E38D|nr:biotin-dependent carboxyltransferase family protein [Pseudomonas taiwanensis]
MIQIQRAAPLATVQDLGRSGYRQYGVGQAGAMDPVAIQLGNALVGNEAGAAAIELCMAPLTIKFQQTASFCLTGAHVAAQLNDTFILPWTCYCATAGQILDLSAIAHGARSYLCISGGIDVPSVLGSRSTQNRGSLGGFEGRYLREGDQLQIGLCTDSQNAPFGIRPPREYLTDMAACPVHVVAAGDAELFTDESVWRFYQSSWTISNQSNRMGFRLNGDPLIFKQPVEMKSHGIIPGVIQVPPNGLPVVQMADANVTGGYPKIGAVIRADLWRLAQMPIGTKIRFAPIDYTDALEMERALQERISSTQKNIEFARRYISRTQPGHTHAN